MMDLPTAERIGHATRAVMARGVRGIVQQASCTRRGWYLTGLRALPLLALVGLAGCQGLTPPARWTAETVDQRTITVATAVPATLSRFYDGVQYCGRGDIPDCGPVRPDGSAACDMYQRGPYGGRGNSLGRLTLAPREGGTTATMVVGRSISLIWTQGMRTAVLDRWQALLEGRAAEICP